jgi:Na+/citrate or Na+/malate symporter
VDPAHWRDVDLRRLPALGADLLPPDAGKCCEGVGAMLGLGAKHTLFFVVVPIMAGGVGEGALPLSMGYAQTLGVEQGPLFAQVLSAVMLGNIAAICCAGFLNYVGTKKPALTGNGQLTRNDDRS